MDESWQDFLNAEFEKDYFLELSVFLKKAFAEKKIFPPKHQVFSAFKTPLDEVKVVIIGQDPYHNDGQAHGLAFSVSETAVIPPSLQNIFKEVQDDVGGEMPENGNLQRWANQGVLLLNNTLTVEAHLAGSHRGKGWEKFTDATIKMLSDKKTGLVFILWGRDARNKKALIDERKHLIIESPHPSPLSAHRGFFGSKPFSKTNVYLAMQGEKPIKW